MFNNDKVERGFLQRENRFVGELGVGLLVKLGRKWWTQSLKDDCSTYLTVMVTPIQQLQKVNPVYGHILSLNPAAILIQQLLTFDCK